MTHVAEPELAPFPEVRRRRRRVTRWRRVKRWVRKHRALTVIFAVALALLVVLLLWLLWLNRQLGEVTRFPTDLGDARPAAGAGTTILLLGVDDPLGRGDLFDVLESGEWAVGAFRSDAIMVLHISEDGDDAQVVSIPRDSYVPVEGLGTTKINAAFSAGGPSMMARTVEDLTDLRIDHTMVIDFPNFTGMIDVLGGLYITVPDTVTDGYSGRVWTEGLQLLDGEDTLAYVRQRAGLPRGDFDRIARQQNVLRTIVADAASAGTLSNPIQLTRLVNSLTDFVAVDESFTPARMRSIGLGSTGIRAEEMAFVTVPTTGTPTIDGASVVTLDPQGVTELFAAVGDDRFASWARDNAVDLLPPVGQVG